MNAQFLISGMTELEERIAQCALKEVEQPTLGTVEQYLEVHELVYENGRPKIARVDTDDPELAIVYFPVKGEKFFYALTVSPKELQCWGMYSEPYSRVCLYIQSAVENTNHILACSIRLQPTNIKDVKVVRANPDGSTSKHVIAHAIRFELAPEADSVEDRVTKMLDYLEQDADGVKKLAATYDAGIRVSMDVHDANSMIGGAHLNAKNIKRLGALGLWIDFDIATCGNEFKDDFEGA